MRKIWKNHVFFLRKGDIRMEQNILQIHVAIHPRRKSSISVSWKVYVHNINYRSKSDARENKINKTVFTSYTGKDFVMTVDMNKKLGAD